MYEFSTSELYEDHRTSEQILNGLQYGG